MAFRILVGDARERLRDLPDASVHCVITSPPYWSLRNYQGDPGMIGMEPTFADHLDNLRIVFREIWRVLRNDGTFWLNYGDSYHNKNLLQMPAKVAMALQDDGWMLRSEIIWHKPAPVPESVTDRPTCAHDKLFLFSKQSRYFYDQFAIRLPPSGRTDLLTFNKANPQRNDTDRAFPIDGMIGANARNVWTVSTHGSAASLHFATFPTKLITPCIKAGTSERGCCPKCTAPYARDTTSTIMATTRNPNMEQRGTKHVDGGDSAMSNRQRTGHRPGLIPRYVTRGWSPTCECNAGRPVPAVVLDPFGGAGTVGMVSEQLGRDSVLVEVSAEYAAFAEKRIRIGHDRADPTAPPQSTWSTLDGWSEQAEA